MLLTLKRGESTDQGTPGVLFAEGFRCFTLELPWRDNAPQLSCIPTGAYECVRVSSPRFGRVYGVMGVSGRSNILIHAGNYAGDTTKGYKAHSHGCILLGSAMGALAGQTAVLASRPALTAFMQHMDGEPFTLEVI